MSQSADGGLLFVPDLHGHLARLQAALAAAQRFPAAHLVFLGDLLDDSPFRRQARGDTRERGAPDDAHEVLKPVRELHAQGRADVLLGNHEVMAIRAVLEDDWNMQELWWQHGGRETAASYGWRPGQRGPLADDLEWLRANGRLWLLAGPKGAQVLAAHATRPRPERLASGQDQFEDLQPEPETDPVVWFPLGQDEVNDLLFVPPLPEGVVASVHGHMLQPHPRVFSGPDGLSMYQLDLHPEKRELALLHLSPAGVAQVVLQAVADD